MVSSGHMLVIGPERWLEVKNYYIGEVRACDDTVQIVGGLKDSWLVNYSWWVEGYFLGQL